MSIVIAIDGPTASGKGTLARRLASTFNFACLDTGLLYRAVGMAVLRQGGQPEDVQSATAAAQALDLTTLTDDASLRSAQAGQAGSIVSAIPSVRQAFLELQRDFAACPPEGKAGAVLDGRDIGTVICPEAPVKLYVTASAEVRAQRRFNELSARGQDSLSFAEVLADIQRRDHRDMNRASAPLRPAADAIILDTSVLNAQETYMQARQHVVTRLPQLDRQG